MEVRRTRAEAEQPRPRPTGVTWKHILIVLVVLAVVAGGYMLYRLATRNAASTTNPSLPPLPVYEQYDTDPQHLANVLGGQEAYLRFANSPLLKTNLPNGYEAMSILNDPGNPQAGIPATPYVVVILRGYITSFDPAERIINIAYEGDSISLRASTKLMQIIIEENGGTLATWHVNSHAEWQDMQVGDYARYLEVHVNRDNLSQSELRSVIIERPANG